MKKTCEISGFKFYYTQEKAFEQGTTESNFYYASDIGNKGAKAYGQPMVFSEFIEQYKEVEDLVSFYELIKAGSPRMEYYDIDKETDKTSEEVFAKFNEIYTKFLEYMNIETAPKWMITDASKEGKVSLHLVNRNRCIKNEIIMKEWYDEFKFFCETHFDENDVFDYSVKSPNRCMRMIGSTKKGQNRPLKLAKWYHTKKPAKKYFFIQNINEDCEVIDEIKTKHVTDTKDKQKETEISTEEMEKRTDDNEVEVLIKLITECVNNGTHSLCDKEAKTKLKYDDFRNFIFAVVNACMSNNIDYKTVIDKFDLYKLYRHCESYNKDNVLKSIYANCESKTKKTENKYTIKSLHYWGRKNDKYNTFFTKKNMEFPEIDMRDEYTFGQWNREYGGRFFIFNSSEFWELLKNFCRVCAIINNGKLEFYIKSNKRTFEILDTVKMAANITIIKKVGENDKKLLLSVKSGPESFNIVPYVPFYDTVKCVPYVGKKGNRENYFNMFGGFEAQYIKNYDVSKIDKILSHLKNIICNGNMEYYYYILSWLASICQHPEKKTKTSIILWSPQGCGKNIFTDFLINYVFGLGITFTCAGLDQILDHFNDHLRGKIFCEIDELPTGDNTASSYHMGFDKFKNLITQDLIAFEEKYGKKGAEENYLNFWASTNNIGSVKIEEGDRRFFVLNVNASRKGDHAYFDSILETFNQENGNIFYSYLMDYEINVSLRKIPYTDLKGEMIENSKTIAELFYDGVKSGEIEMTPDGGGNIFTVAHFYEMFTAWSEGTGNMRMSLQRMTKILHSKFGGAFMNIRLKGKQTRCIKII